VAGGVDAPRRLTGLDHVRIVNQRVAPFVIGRMRPVPSMPRRGGRSLIAGLHDATLSVAEWAFTQSLHGRPT